MLKKFLCGILFLGILFSLSAFSFAAEMTDFNAELYLSSIENNSDFGGACYDESGKLSINWAGEITDLRYAGVADTKEVTYHQVEYSIKELEDVKDYLAQYMGEFSIQMLDANEATNKIDVYFSDYSAETILRLKNIVQTNFPEIGSSALAFIDYGNSTIKSTIASVESQPKYSYEETLKFLGYEAADQARVATPRLILITGLRIYMANGGYTLGPAVSSTKGYSAGHGFGIMLPTSDVTYGSSVIGRATPHFGGAQGDWSSIALSSFNTFANIHSPSTPIQNASVCMVGSESGRTSGKILATNMTLSYEGQTVSGMCQASYYSYYGDSGAGVFIDANPVNKYVGIQAASAFESGTDIWITSFFTPSTKLA